MSKIIGSALFYNEDQVRNAPKSELLPRLIRIILFSLRITNDQYLDRYREWWNRTFPDRHKKEFGQKTSADRKVLLKSPDLTFKMVNNIVVAMGYDVECISVRIKDRMTGEIMIFSTDDTVDSIKAEQAKEKPIGIDSLV